MWHNINIVIWFDFGTVIVVIHLSIVSSNESLPFYSKRSIPADKYTLLILATLKKAWAYIGSFVYKFPKPTPKSIVPLLGVSMLNTAPG